jgi:imidazolonepropionase-like amidohydrolase
MRSFRRLLATFFVFALVVGLPSLASAQSTTILRGGQLFDATDTTLTDNPGIVVRAGKIVARGATNLDTTGARVVQLDADQVILPGLIDLHAHYAVDFFGAGRVEETEGYPLLYLANGATTFTAGEMQPEKMRRVRRAIERGERRGPRLLTSGPYFGKTRPGGTPPARPPAFAQRSISGRPAASATSRPNGCRRSCCGSSSTRPTATPDEPAFADITEHFKRHHVYFDATISAYGYYGTRDSDLYADWPNAQQYFTPYLRRALSEDDYQEPISRFQQIFELKLDRIKAFYDAGAGDLITLGTNHPSWGEYLAPFGVHRELQAFVRAGIPEAAALRIATINGARAG